MNAHHLCLALLLLSPCIATADLSGRVQFNRVDLANAEVTLYVCGDNKPPLPVSRTTTGHDGTFRLDDSAADGSAVRYLVVRGRAAKSPVVLLAVLGGPMEHVVVNELTTVASAFTCAQFFDGSSLSGPSVGLKIAAGNAPNLVDPATGQWGDVLLDGINSTQNETLARLNTLAALITASGTVADDGWRARLMTAATPIGGSTPEDTLEAMVGIARSPWAHAGELYELFNQAYPQPHDGFPYTDSDVPASRRAAPFAPYLAYVPEDFSMILCFAGGGIYAAGKLCFDANGNLWSGQNWMPGSQSGCYRGIGGGVVKLAPNGRPLSPPLTGFMGMGIDGIGWGTGVSRTNVWATSFNGRIAVFDFDGRPAATADDVPEALRNLGGLQGVGVAPNGDVWIPATSADKMLHFPGGDLKAGRLVDVDGLMAPFGVVIDRRNRVWVSNTTSNVVIRFPADDPSQTTTFKISGGGRGVALDSRGNCWVACNTSPHFPPDVTPEGISILEQFAIGYPHLVTVLGKSHTTGVVGLIPADDSSPPASFHGGGAVNVPWGVSIDGNDDAWVANWLGRGVLLMAGATPRGRSAAHPTGDLIHEFKSGSIQMLTDVVVDPAGNVWCANNWNVAGSVIQAEPARPFSTWGGGSGLVVIYGVASPVRTPLTGPVVAAGR